MQNNNIKIAFAQKPREQTQANKKNADMGKKISKTTCIKVQIQDLVCFQLSENFNSYQPCMHK